MTATSPGRAGTWPYRRYSAFRSTVASAASEWFERRGLETQRRYPYILASRDSWPQNILVPEVATFIQQKAAEKKGKEAFPLHKYIHHGLSSQAMLFNLVGPPIVRGDLAPLARVLCAKGIAASDRGWAPELEYESREVFREDSGQPTSIDLALMETSGNPRVFIECKFVEREFGRCSVFTGGDCDGRNPASDFNLCYLHHIGRRYWDVAKTHGLLDGPLSSEALCPLAVHYQFFRELLFALEMGGVFVLLSDARSPVFCQDGTQGERGLMPVVMSMLPDTLRQKVMMVTIQEVLDATTDPVDADWTIEFRRKYGLVEGGSRE